MKKYQFSKEQLALMESMRQPFAVYQFVEKRVVTLALSEGFLQLFGYEDRARAYFDMGHNMYIDTHPDDKARIAEAAFRFATEGGRYEVIYRTRNPRGSGYTVIHAIGEHVYTDDGTRLAQVWYMDEGAYVKGAVSDNAGIVGTLSHALNEQSALKASRYDYLTGLPSMTHFFELSILEKDKILKNGGEPVMLYVDFSGMKYFNTRHGFAEGDMILQAFARLLIAAFGNENCCRIAGDHFAVIAEEAGIEEKLRGIFKAFADSFDGKTPPVHVGIYPRQIEDVPASTACDRAKFACSVLKGTYTSAYAYFSPKLRENVVQKQYIIENLDTAIREKWIQVYLQPIIRAVNEQVCDVEALARWVDPEKGIMSPALFIPALEETGLIYKLDLYMLDEILEMIKQQRQEGFRIIPHSINLSRIDFEACDIVEEIRRRVDDAGIDRGRITVEITESVIGGDSEFMKKQVERFQSLGFPVWMDDFGSGYSSLDVLQSIRFDTIKFDMSFMRKLDEGDSGKVILTELMRMATSLGVDTVCEGVETQEQARFLQEIGCSKLQGYYFSKPVPFELIREMHRNNTLIETENPAESDYYESIGRVNLFDLGVIASDDENALQKTFNTIPIAILEVSDSTTRYVRSNHSYRDFLSRFFKMDLLSDQPLFQDEAPGYGQSFISVIRQCRNNGNSAFFNETMPDGAVVHAFARRINENPVSGSVAIAIAVLSISDSDDGMSYAEIAKALAADYYNIFVIDMDTNDYIEYSSQIGGEELSIKRRGLDFFESARRDTMTRIYEEDRAGFLKWFSKANVVRELDAQGVFTATYRLIDSGEPVYVNMKITRLQGGNRIILGISIIDAQMKQQEEEKRLRREKISLGRIAALAPNYIVLYTVDPVTGHYTQYNPSKEYERFGLSKQGEDFFRDARLDAARAIDPRDMERHLSVLTRDNVLREIHKNGFFIHNYRLLLDGKPVPVSLRATLVQEDDGEKIILGVNRVIADAPDSRESEVIYTHIAHALARGNTDLFYVNMESEEFIEYHTDDNLGVLTEARRGNDFFASCIREAKLYVHPDDQAAFLSAMNHDFLVEALEQSRVFVMSYRRILDGRTFYVEMKTSRMEDDTRMIVIAVSDIDELMRKRRAEERVQEERTIYARLHALTGNYIVVYVVDPETDSYREFSATDNYVESFAQATEGERFFDKVREVARQFNHPDDLDRFITAFTKENIFREIERRGMFTLGYRILMDGKPRHVQLKAALVEERDGTRLIVGLNDIDGQVRQEEEYGKRLAQAQSEAKIDALTGVKNKHAYNIAADLIDSQIAEHRQKPFAVVVFDVNDLKKVNDTTGHQAGDQYLKDACKIICDVFKRSPVFRIGGDEFAVISQGDDYAAIEALLDRVRSHNAAAADSGGIVIACGMAKYEGDSSVAEVFARADHNMYENKNDLKAHEA